MAIILTQFWLAIAKLPMQIRTLIKIFHVRKEAQPLHGHVFLNRASIIFFLIDNYS